MTEAQLNESYGRERMRVLTQSDIEKKVTERLKAVLRGSGPLQPIIDYLCSSQGKMLRPKLLVLSGQAFRAFRPVVEDNFDVAHLVDMAAACEMVHMASLVHDDIIDGSSKRRGLPTVHLLWGIHSAILAGDYLFTKAHGIALQYDYLDIPKILNWAIEMMCRGEVAQDARVFSCDVSREEYILEVTGKTAALFGACCRIGAVLAGADAKESDMFFDYGLNLGRAFQIIDDILDMVSSEKDLGKPACSDLRRGLLTLPLLLAVEDGYDDLDGEFSRRSVSDSKIEAAKRHVFWGKYHRKACDIADDYIGAAMASLETIPPCQSRSMLLSLGRQLRGRLDLIRTVAETF